MNDNQNSRNQFVQNGSKNLKITPCNCYYLSSKPFDRRIRPDDTSTIVGKGASGLYYVADAVVSGRDGRIWFRHADADEWSVIEDPNHEIIFLMSGSYSTKKTVCDARIRAGAGISKPIIDTLFKGKTIYWTGHTIPSNGVAWAEIIINGKKCYCDERDTNI